MIKNLIAKIIGWRIAASLKLKENQTMETKKWYQSKTILSDIVTVLVSIYTLVGTSLGPDFGWHLPSIPAWVFTILGAIGIYGRKTATTTVE